MTDLPLPSRDYRPRFSAHKSFWLFAALLVCACMLLYRYGMHRWFMQHFGDLRTLSIVAILMAFFALGALRHVWPLARALAVNERAMKGFDLATGKDVPHDQRVDAAALLLERAAASARIRKEDSPLASTLANLKELVDTSVACERQPHFDLLSFREQFEERVSGLFEGLSATRTLLISLGLVGTIFGLVSSMAANKQLPVTPEETKGFIFFLLQGMGVAYVSGLFAWSGTIALYLFENVCRRQANAQAALFRDRMLSFVQPAIESPAFSKRMQERSSKA